MPELTLYYYDSCPFCRRVLHYLEQNEIKIPLKNLLTSIDIRQELVKIGGKSQVPCLVIDGKALYESNDIIQWFEENWRKET